MVLILDRQPTFATASICFPSAKYLLMSKADIFYASTGVRPPCPVMRFRTLRRAMCEYMGSLRFNE